MRSFYNKISSNKALLGSKPFNFFLFLLVVSGLRASAATYPVTDFTDGLAINQLRGALKAADDAGGSHTITLAAGTYNLTLGEVVFGNKAQNIIITGAGSGSTTINMTTTNQDRIFLINPTGTIANVIVSISGIKFTGGRINISSLNGHGPHGGGAILAGGPNNSLAITNCIFQNNTAPAGCGSGGAIAYNAGGTLNIDQCTFTGNLSQDANGGAVSYFLENSVSGSVSLTNSNFTNNSVTAAAASGGAVFIGVQGTLGGTTFSATVTKNTFTGNTALSGVAGAIIIDNGFSSSNTVLVNYNRFTNNAAGTAPQALGMNSAQGHVDATNNWWGCNGGPAVCTDRAAIVGSGGAGTLNLANWLQLKATATPAIVCRGGSTLVTASFLTNSAGAAVTTANLSTLIGQPINFTNPVLGTASGAQTIIQVNGTATATFTAGITPGAGSLNAVVDNIPNNDAIAKAAVTINAPLLTASQTNVSCFGGSNGTASVTVSGSGTAPYTYDWTPGAPTGDGTATITGLAAGTYTVAVTDANGCTNTQSFTITQPSAPLSVTSSSQTNVSCNGGSNGVATVGVTGGTPGYTYSWSPSGGTGATASGLAAGTYTVTVTDANLCQTIQSFTITQPAAALSGTTLVTNVACNGGNTGAIDLTPSGGTPPYTYNWGSGITTQDRISLVAGNYSVTITDANGCTSTVNATVSQPAAAISGSAVITNVSCNGGSNGTINLTPSGGTPPYTYNWGEGITSEDRTGLTAGTYSVTITDANGCTATRTFTITQPTALVAAAGGQTNVSCNGGANGTATVSVTGGTPSYTYSWAPSGGTAATATGLGAGTYTVTVTDANACTATQSFTITQPAGFTVTTSQTNVSCNGGSNGTATVSVSGGAGSYTYSWAPSGGTGPTASGLTVGTYTVTITDANTCTTTRTFTITQPSAFTIATSQTNVACNGGATGSASVLVSGGTGPYSYSWSPSGGTGSTATGLTAGTYTVTIEDFNGCSTTRTFTLTQPSAAISGSAVITNVSCNGGANGAVNLTPSGGTPPYTYNWGEGITSEDRTGLTAGTYSVTITDANGCTATRTFTITQPTALVAAAGGQTNVSCNGGANGTATVSVTGGTPSYTYSWAPSGGTAATASGLVAGTYTVTVTDANACQTTQSFTITQPSAPLSATSSSQTNVSCNGGSNGVATVGVTGGTPGYTYSWSPSGGTGATASGLAAGTYTVTVTDANLCQTTQSFTITQPAALTATTGQTNIACNGGSNGEASVNVSGGTAPYTYAWSSGGGTAATASGLVAGVYSCTVTDANGCTLTRNFTITQPAALGVSSISVPAYGTYTGGDNLDFTINFSQPVTITTSSGLPFLEIVLGNGTSSANYIAGSGTNSLTFRYTVGATDQDPDGLSFGNIISNGGLLQYGAGCTAPGIMGGVPPTTGFIIHNPVAQTITFNTLANKTYGDADFDPGATASSGLPLSYTSSNPAVATIVAGKVHIAGAGSATITASQPGTTDYLPAAAVSQSLTVSPKVLTVAADAQTKTYGDIDPALSYSVTGLVGPDLLTGDLDRTPGNDAGTYPINLGTLTGGTNYSVTYIGANLTIVPKAVTVMALAQNKTYGDADPALSYTVTPALVGSDAFSGALSRVAGEEVGVYAIGQNTLALSTNYVLTYTGAGLTITKKAVTVTADAKSKTYGDADPVLTYTVSPALVSGDAFTGALSRTAGEGVGNYAISQNTLALNGNYAITYTGANLRIGQKTVTVTAEAKNKTYGDADPALTYTVTPALVSGDAFTGSLSRTAGENVGSYTINQNTLALNANYVLNYTGASFTIGKKAATVTAAAKTKIYGTADPALTYTVSPALVNGDVLTGALSRTAGEDVGSYAINQGTLAHGNYAISFVAGSLTITKAAQQITWNQSLVAGCDGNTTIALTATASSGLPVTYQSGNAGIATIINNQLVITGPGTTYITASQPGNNNYLPAAAVQQELTSKLPAQLMVKRWDDVLVFDNSSNQYTAWQWYKNGSAINGATGQHYHEATKLNGDYYAVVKTAAGTAMQTCPVTITPGVTFIPISIFPNPVDPGQTITVKTGYSAAQLQGATIVVTNMLGAVVQTVQNVAPQTNITMPVAQGLYAIRLKLANGVTASINALVRPQ